MIDSATKTTSTILDLSYIDSIFFLDIIIYSSLLSMIILVILFFKLDFEPRKIFYKWFPNDTGENEKLGIGITNYKERPNLIKKLKELEKKQFSD